MAYDVRVFEALEKINEMLRRIATAIERAHNVVPCFGAAGVSCDQVGVSNAPGYRPDVKFCAGCVRELRSKAKVSDLPESGN